PLPFICIRVRTRNRNRSSSEWKENIMKPIKIYLFFVLCSFLILPIPDLLSAEISSTVDICIATEGVPLPGEIFLPNHLRATPGCGYGGFDPVDGIYYFKRVIGSDLPENQIYLGAAVNIQDSIIREPPRHCSFKIYVYNGFGCSGPS